MNRTAFFTALAVLVVVAVALLALRLSFVLMLAFAGVLLAVLLRSLAALVVRYTRLPIGLALTGVVLGITALIVALVVFAGARIGAELVEVAFRVPEAWAQVRDHLSRQSWGAYLLEVVPSGGDRPRWNLTGIVGGTVSSIVSAGVNLAVVLAVGIFVAAEPRLYSEGFLHLVPKARRARAGEILNDIGRGLWHWLIGQSIDMVAVALAMGLGLWLIGVPAPIALGLIAGVTNFIPFVGPWIGGVPAVLVAFTGGTMDAVYTLLLIVVVQQVESQVLMPIVQKYVTALPPALTILAVLAMGLLFGITGMLLATPLLLVAMMTVQALYVEETLGDHSVEDGVA